LAMARHALNCEYKWRPRRAPHQKHSVNIWNIDRAILQGLALAGSRKPLRLRDRFAGAVIRFLRK
jgi:hypothetical protein